MLLQATSRTLDARGIKGQGDKTAAQKLDIFSRTKEAHRAHLSASLRTPPNLRLDIRSICTRFYMPYKMSTKISYVGSLLVAHATEREYIY